MRKSTKALGVAAALASCIAASHASAETAAPVPYPQRIVTLVTHSSPGSGSDVFLRELVKYLHKYINANFIVENDGGGSGAKAMSRVAIAKPDGSTFYAATPTYILTSLLSKPSKTYRDLEPVVNFFTDAGFVYARADGPYKTLNDVIDRAKNARGRWGVSNPGSLERQAAEALKRAAKVNVAIVSHDGGSAMMINVLNGTLDAGFGEIEEIRAQLEGRKLRLLATLSDARIEGFLDVPTAKELGYNVVLVKFRGLVGPKGLPPEIVKVWDDAAQKILADPEYRKMYEAENLVPLYLAHDRYEPYIAQFAADTGTFLKAAGVIR